MTDKDDKQGWRKKFEVKGEMDTVSNCNIARKWVICGATFSSQKSNYKCYKYYITNEITKMYSHY